MRLFCRGRMALPLLLAVLASPAAALADPVPPATADQLAALSLPRPMEGVASWYGHQHVGRPTANGEIHSAHLRTAAHRNLPFGTLVRVTNLRNGRTSVVRINDRGPYVGGRTIDLSEKAARDLAMIDDGLVPVRLEILRKAMP